MDIIERVNQDTQALKRVWQDPDNLSALGLRLALLYEELGDLVSEAQLASAEAKERYEYDLAKRTLELVEEGAPVSRSELRAKLDYREGYRMYLTADNKYAMLKRKRDSVEKVIDASRSRLSLIKSDIRNS